MFANLGVIGAGAWGTALAQTTRAAGHDVMLWAFEAAVAEEINNLHTNAAYLADVVLDEAIRARCELADFAERDVILLVVPAQHVRRIATELVRFVPEETPIVICSKGIEQATGKLMTDVLAEAAPAHPVAVLSGPSFAHEVAAGLPVAVTLAAGDATLGENLAKALAHRAFRPYWSDDVVGVEVGGAVKNVLAIAAGIVAGQGLGASAHAALVARGFAEIVSVGKALGAREETLAGLSGLGDLVLTCASPRSRNMSLGRSLGEGRGLDDILGARRSVAEGVQTAEAVIRIADRHGLELPICRAVDAIVAGQLAVGEAIEGLLARPLRREV